MAWGDIDQSYEDFLRQRQRSRGRSAYAQGQAEYAENQAEGQRREDEDRRQQEEYERNVRAAERKQQEEEQRRDDQERRQRAAPEERPDPHQEPWRTENAPWRAEPWWRKPPPAGRETGDVRKRFLGDPELAQRYIGPARTLLGLLKNDMAFNQLDQGMRRAIIPIEERIESGPFRRPTAEGAGIPDTGHNDWLMNPAGASGGEGSEERTERRIMGNVHLYAMSSHGQDQVWIDARAVTTIEETKVPGAGLEYFPYLWVGMATEGGGTVAPYTGFGDPAEAFRHVGLHVFEPLTDEELAEVLASPGQSLGYKHYAGSASDGIGVEAAVASSNKLTIGPFPSEFSEDVPWDHYQTPNNIWYSDDKLYYMGHGVAGSLAPDRDSEHARLWQKAVCLDPDDPKKTLNATGPFNYANRSYGGYALSGTEWQLKGTVKPGKYLVKLNAYYGPTCAWHAGPAFDVILKIIVGKPPGRQTIKEIRLPFPRNQWSEFARDMWPNINEGPEEWDELRQFTGPNTHARMWWQQGIEVDVQLGTIAETNEEDGPVLPPWGFDTTKPGPIKEICWLAYTQAASDEGGVIYSVQEDKYFYVNLALDLPVGEQWASGRLVIAGTCEEVPLPVNTVTDGSGIQVPGGPEGSVCVVDGASDHATSLTGSNGVYQFPEGYTPAARSVPDGETIEYPYSGFSLTANSNCGSCGTTSVSWQEQYP